MVPADRLRILAETVRWSRSISYEQGVSAIGPAYLLAWVISHPSTEAGVLRKTANDAHRQITDSLVRLKG